MTEEKRSELKVFNRAIGTATGWDDIEPMILQFYDFTPYDGFDMPKGTLIVDYENGVFMNFNEEGDVLAEKDFLSIMNGFIARHTIKNGNSFDAV